MECTSILYAKSLLLIDQSSSSFDDQHNSIDNNSINRSKDNSIKSIDNLQDNTVRSSAVSNNINVDNKYSYSHNNTINSSSSYIDEYPFTKQLINSMIDRNLFQKPPTSSSSISIYSTPPNYQSLSFTTNNNIQPSSTLIVRSLSTFQNPVITNVIRFQV
jgi:hypothetical protein